MPTRNRVAAQHASPQHRLAQGGLHPPAPLDFKDLQKHRHQGRLGRAGVHGRRHAHPREGAHGALAAAGEDTDVSRVQGGGVDASQGHHAQGHQAQQRSHQRGLLGQAVRLRTFTCSWGTHLVQSGVGHGGLRDRQGERRPLELA